jgi:hypothetical protein
LPTNYIITSAKLPPYKQAKSVARFCIEAQVEVMPISPTIAQINQRKYSKLCIAINSSSVVE